MFRLPIYLFFLLIVCSNAYAFNGLEFFPELRRYEFLTLYHYDIPSSPFGVDHVYIDPSFQKGIFIKLDYKLDKPLSYYKEQLNQEGHSSEELLIGRTTDGKDYLAYTFGLSRNIKKNQSSFISPFYILQSYLISSAAADDVCHLNEFDSANETSRFAQTAVGIANMVGEVPGALARAVFHCARGFYTGSKKGLSDFISNLNPITAFRETKALLMSLPTIVTGLTDVLKRMFKNFEIKVNGDTPEIICAFLGNISSILIPSLITGGLGAAGLAKLTSTFSRTLQRKFKSRLVRNPLSYLQSNFSPKQFQGTFLLKLEKETLSSDQWKDYISSQQKVLRKELKDLPDHDLEEEIGKWMHDYKSKNSGYIAGLSPESDAINVRDLLNPIDSTSKMAKITQPIRNMEGTIAAFPEMTELLPANKLTNLATSTAQNLYPTELLREYARRHAVTP